MEEEFRLAFIFVVCLILLFVCIFAHILSKIHSQIRAIKSQVDLNKMKLTFWDSLIFEESESTVNNIEHYVKRDNVVYLTPPEDDSNN